MNYESFLKTSLAKYQNADFVQNEVLKVMEIFSDLRPKLNKAEFADGCKRVLLQLEGTIPVEYRGKTYNIPICVWILDNYPYQGPVTYVIPTSSMYINQNESVDVNGRVCTDYLKKWQYPNSNLMGFLFDLTEVFGRDPPLLTANCSSGGTAELIVNLQLKNYTHVLKTKQDAVRIMNVFPDLTANMQEFPFTNGTRKLVLSLEGTIPVVFRGKMYKTPVSVRLMEQHPYQAPKVYVKPSPGMMVNISRYVDKTGKVHTPYLAEWNYPDSDLLGLMQEMTVIFGKTPPLFTISKTEQTSMKTTNFTSPDEEVPAPRVCHIRKWPDFQGYGFNVHCEKDTTGRYIDFVDANSPAESADLRKGDRIIEINGENIGGMSHEQVIQKIKSGGDETKMLVVDAEADEYYTNNGIQITSDLPEVIFKETSRKEISGQPKSVSSVQPACSDNALGDETRADTAKLDSGQVPGRVVAGMDELNLGSAEDFDIHCDPCNAESSFVEAEGFCIDCKEYYCKACLRYHRKISATKKTYDFA